MTKFQYDLDSGKYTLVFDKGNFHALRHGEVWRDLTGDNLVFHLTMDVINARNCLQQILKSIEDGGTLSDDDIAAMARKALNYEEQL